MMKKSKDLTLEQIEIKERVEDMSKQWNENVKDNEFTFDNKKVVYPEIDWDKTNKNMKKFIDEMFEELD